jgi:hypothetical protein
MMIGVAAKPDQADVLVGDEGRACASAASAWSATIFGTYFRRGQTSPISPANMANTRSIESTSVRKPWLSNSEGFVNHCHGMRHLESARDPRLKRVPYD